MPIARVGDNDIFYTLSRGQGPVVVLIHGAGGSHLHWPASLRCLAGGAVYALDLPGHGRSKGQARDQIEHYAADLVGFLDALRVEQAVLVGHSMGGAIAQTTALAAPERVSGLVLVGTGAKLGVAPAILQGLQDDFEGAVRLITTWAWGPGADPTLVAQGQQAMVETGALALLRDFTACNGFDVREQVDQIAVPALVLTGSEDRLTPARFGHWLADHIPDAHLVLIEAAGHMVMLEKPAEVTHAIEGFLKRTESA